MSAILDVPPKSHVALMRSNVSPVLRPQRPEERLFSVKEYDRMLECGIFSSGERAELLNGVVYKLMTKGTKHSSATDCATGCFYGRLAGRVVIRNQNPIALDEFSEPEPDLVLCRPEQQAYSKRHPGPADILLVMEVADSSVAYDRDDKGLAYARAGLPQYLLLNVNTRTLTDFREPSAEGFRSQRTYGPGQSLNLVAFADVSVSVDDFLPSD